MWEGPEFSPGKHTIVFDYSPMSRASVTGKGVLSVDGKEMEKDSMENGTAITYPEDETLMSFGHCTGVAMIEYR